MSESLYRTAFGRPPSVAGEAMVATSHPLAARAGLRAFERGGNAADAALAAAAMLCVVEPMNLGIGGDLFALVWRDGEVDALDAAGPAPASAQPLTPVERRGPRSVTVPGATAGWALLSERYGRLGLDTCLADAIDAARTGVALSVRTAAMWVCGDPCPPELGPLAPEVGAKLAFPELAGSLERIASEGSEAVYRGAIARAIADATWLTEEDLAGYEARWVTPLRAPYRGHELVELPPPTQGVAALEGVALLEPLEPTLVNQIHCTRLALEDAVTRVRDGADVGDLLHPGYLDARRAQAPRPVSVVGGDTAYLCAVDGDRMAVSLIGSLFQCFGSGVVAAGTGIALQNRGFGFATEGAVAPGRRPFHTIIPALLLRGGALAGALGLVGGDMQAQGHLQLVSALVDDGVDPQEALDRPRFKVVREQVFLEQGLWDRAHDLEQAGMEPVQDCDWIKYGSGQVILVRDGALVGGSDSRMDGYAAGF